MGFKNKIFCICTFSQYFFLLTYNSKLTNDLWMLTEDIFCCRAVQFNYKGYDAFPYWTLHTFAGACFVCTAASGMFRLWGIKWSVTQTGESSSFYQTVHFWSLVFSGAVVLVQKRYKARWIFDLFLYRVSNVPKLLWTAKIERNVANVGLHKTYFLYMKCSTEGSWLNPQSSRICCRTLFFRKMENIK